MLNKKNITVFHAAPPNKKMSLCIFQFTVDMASLVVMIKHSLCLNQYEKSVM